MAREPFDDVQVVIEDSCCPSYDSTACSDVAAAFAGLDSSDNWIAVFRFVVVPLGHAAAVEVRNWNLKSKHLIISEFEKQRKSYLEVASAAVDGLMASFAVLVGPLQALAFVVQAFADNCQLDAVDEDVHLSFVAASCPCSAVELVASFDSDLAFENCLVPTMAFGNFAPMLGDIALLGQASSFPASYLLVAFDSSRCSESLGHTFAVADDQEEQSLYISPWRVLARNHALSCDTN